MAPEDSGYTEEWKRIAAKDLKRVNALLDLDDPEAAGFFLQQTVEKSLKAFLLSKGWRLRRIHDLNALLDDALAFAPSLEEFRSACQRISAFYFA
jgi:HEPN domain-containing protein